MWLFWILNFLPYFINVIIYPLYGSHKDGYETFAEWKKVWTSNGKSEPSLKAFMADQQLPFWVCAELFH